MGKYIGKLVKVGVAQESSRGAGATPVYALPFDTFDFDDKVTKARSQGALGKLDDSEEAFVTTLFGQGTLGGELRDKSFGLFLKALVGALTTTGPSDSAYTHAGSLSHTNQHQSLSFVVDDNNQAELYKLVMLDSFEMTVELDQVVKYSLGFMAKRGVETGLTVPAVVEENKFTKKHLQLKIASSIAGLSGASVLSPKRLVLRINKNVQMDDSLGTADPEDFVNGPISVEGEIDFNYTDETYKNYMRNNSHLSMEIKLVNTDEVIGAATRPTITIQLPKVDFFDWAPSYPQENLITQRITFKANRDIANSLDMISTFSVVNAVTSY